MCQHKVFEASCLACIKEKQLVMVDIDENDMDDDSSEEAMAQQDRAEQEENSYANYLSGE